MCLNIALQQDTKENEPSDNACLLYMYDMKGDLKVAWEPER